LCDLLSNFNLTPNQSGHYKTINIAELNHASSFKIKENNIYILKNYNVPKKL